MFPTLENIVFPTSQNIDADFGIMLISQFYGYVSSISDFCSFSSAILDFPLILMSYFSGDYTIVFSFEHPFQMCTTHGQLIRLHNNMRGGVAAHPIIRRVVKRLSIGMLSGIHIEPTARDCRRHICLQSDDVCSM